MTHGKRQVGFTLVELLVVVAIISILAAILLPALSRSIENARSVQCMNNLRQVGSGLSMYVGDFGGFLPWGRSDHWKTKLSSEGYLPATAYGYLQPNWEAHNPSTVLICRTDYALDDDKFIYVSGYRGSYGGNTAIMGTTDVPYDHKRLARYRQPTRTVIVGERQAGAVHNDPQWRSNISNQTSFELTGRYKHNGMQNILLLDWHVKPIHLGNSTEYIVTP